MRGKGRRPAGRISAAPRVVVGRRKVGGGGGGGGSGKWEGDREEDSAQLRARTDSEGRSGRSGGAHRVGPHQERGRVGRIGAAAKRIDSSLSLVVVGTAW
jgi:hypothetical protein